MNSLNVLSYKLILVGSDALVDAEVKGKLSDLVLQRSRDVPAVVSDKVSDARLGQRVVQLGRVVVGGYQDSVLLQIKVRLWRYAFFRRQLFRLNNFNDKSI